MLLIKNPVLLFQILIPMYKTTKLSQLISHIDNLLTINPKKVDPK